VRARTGGGGLCWCVRACSEPGSEAKRWAPRGSLVVARRSRESGCLFPRSIIHTTASPPPCLRPFPLPSPSPSFPNRQIHRFTSCPSRLVVPRDFSCTHAISRTCAVVFVKSVPARTHTRTHTLPHSRTHAFALVGSPF